MRIEGNKSLVLRSCNNLQNPAVDELAQRPLPEDGAREGAVFIRNNIIRVTEKAFDDFAGTGSDEAFNRKILGI